MKRRKIFIPLFIVIIILIIDSIYIGYFKKNNIESNNNIVNEEESIEEEIEENLVLNLQQEYNNTDIKGIISIENESSFNYPIVQTTDNDYYLSHDYYKNYDAYGSIYADYRVDLDDSRKILLFGHSSSHFETPFGKLENYYDKDYYEEHKYIYLTTESNTYKYEIFSIYVETSDFTYMNINFSSDEAYYNHILKLQSNSLYDIDVTLNSDDKILIMQTCSNNIDYQAYDNKYLLIISRRV